MKTTILIAESRTQLVLQPESGHDENVLKILESLPNTYRAEFYDTKGGWTNGTADGTNDDLLIVFDAQSNPQETK